MALVLEILLGVAILASFGIAYFSARTWRIYQVLLAEFLFLALVGFFWLSADPGHAQIVAHQGGERGKRTRTIAIAG